MEDGKEGKHKGNGKSNKGVRNYEKKQHVGLDESK